MSTPSPSPASSRRARCRATTSIKYATSILDYVFRELAVSYMSRFDLAHVDPSESDFDALGKRRRGRQGDRRAAADQATKYLSRGLTRSRTDNLVVMRGGSRRPLEARTVAPAERAIGVADLPRLPPAHRRRRRRRRRLQAGSQPRPLADREAGSAAMEQGRHRRDADRPTKAERRAEAKAKGYEGEMCGECGNFTLVRNGTCMKCDTCGSTTGCS